MKGSKRRKEFIWKFKKTHSISLIAYLLFIFANVSIEKAISKVNDMTILGSSQKERKMVGRFGGSLIETIDQKKNTTKLIFDFRLLEKEDKAAFKKSFRAKLEVIVDPSRLSNGVYEDAFSQDDQNRFSFNLYKENTYYRGVEPRDEFTYLEISNLTLKANLTQKSDLSTEVNLIDLNLALSINQAANLNQEPAFVLNFMSKNNTKKRFSGLAGLYYLYTPWVLPLLFLYLVGYSLLGFLAGLILKSINKIGINKELNNIRLGYMPLFLYEEFYTFYMLRCIQIISLVFLYQSSWSFLLFLALSFAELTSQLISWGFGVAFFGLIFSVTLINSDFYAEPFALLLYNVINEDRWKRFHHKKNFSGITLSAIGTLLAMIYPEVLLYMQWILALGAIYCSVLTRYKNPSFADFLSWIIFFSFCALVSIIYVSCYLSVGYTSVFLEGFFSTWMELITVQSKGLLDALSVMTGVIFIDFMVIKTKILSVLPQKRIKAGTKISKVRANHQPGVVSYQDSFEIELKSPFLSGIYAKNSYDSKDIRLDYMHLQGNRGARSGWKFKLQYDTTCPSFYIHRVIYKGKQKPELVGVLRRSRAGRIMLKIFNLRTRMVDLSSLYEIERNVIDEVERLQWVPKALQIRDFEHILVFFGNFWMRKDLMSANPLSKIKGRDSILAILDLKRLKGEDAQIRVREEKFF